MVWGSAVSNSSSCSVSHFACGCKVVFNGSTIAGKFVLVYISQLWVKVRWSMFIADSTRELAHFINGSMLWSDHIKFDITICCTGIVLESFTVQKSIVLQISIITITIISNHLKNSINLEFFFFNKHSSSAYVLVNSLCQHRSSTRSSSCNCFTSNTLPKQLTAGNQVSYK